jgi:hypothetical protein
MSEGPQAEVAAGKARVVRVLARRMRTCIGGKGCDAWANNGDVDFRRCEERVLDGQKGAKSILNDGGVVLNEPTYLTYWWFAGFGRHGYTSTMAPHLGSNGGGRSPTRCARDGRGECILPLGATTKEPNELRAARKAWD